MVIGERGTDGMHPWRAIFANGGEKRIADFVLIE
jgi:hypothetical protein